jgi:hypothetical protein
MVTSLTSRKKNLEASPTVNSPSFFVSLVVDGLIGSGGDEVNPNLLTR